MRDWTDFGAWEERHKELMREAEDRRLVRELRLDTRRAPGRREKLPAGGWRRRFALLGSLSVPFFRAFGG